MSRSPKRPKLSKAEQRVYLTALRMARLKKYEFTNPTTKDIAERLGVTTPAIQQIKAKLTDKGYAAPTREFQVIP